MTTRFVALGVAPRVREALDGAMAPVRRRWPDHAWTDPLGWHVTLAFLGALPDAAVAGIVAAVADALAGGSGVHPPRRLRVGSTTSFGDRVLVARIEDEPEGSVARLGSRVQSALVATGAPVQQGEVRAHLTLARARRGRTLDGGLLVAARHALATASRPMDWEVARVGVWSSHPRPHAPARYLVDAEVPFVS